MNVRKTVSATTQKLKDNFNLYHIILNFSLLSCAENQEDALQIVEQILPFFTPAYTLTINVPEMGIKDDFPLILEVLKI